MTEMTRGWRLVARSPHHLERPTKTSRRTGQQRRAPNQQLTTREEVRAPIRRAVTQEECEQQDQSTSAHRERLHPHHSRFSFEFRKNTTHVPFRKEAPPHQSTSRSPRSEVLSTRAPRQSPRGLGPRHLRQRRRPGKTVRPPHNRSISTRWKRIEGNPFGGANSSIWGGTMHRQVHPQARTCRRSRDQLPLS